jgi:hypothetical protein
VRKKLQGVKFITANGFKGTFLVCHEIDERSECVSWQQSCLKIDERSECVSWQQSCHEIEFFKTN